MWRRLLALACAVCVAGLSGAAAASAQMPAAGHYAGETGNILIGPARIQFEVRDLGGGEWQGEHLFCGCGVRLPWATKVIGAWLHASSTDPSVPASAELHGSSIDGRRFEGWGVAHVPAGRLEWTWWADRVAELGPAEADAEALGELGEEAAGDDAVLGPGSDRVTRVEGELGRLTDRIAADAEQAARVEGLPHPAAYGATSPQTRAAVARLERDAARDRHRLKRRAAAIERVLRRMSAEERARHPRVARRLRALGRRIAEKLAKLRHEVG